MRLYMGPLVHKGTELLLPLAQSFNNHVKRKKKTKKTTFESIVFHVCPYALQAQLLLPAC